MTPGWRTLLLAGFAAGSPGVAHAHAFVAGQGAYQLFLEGASLPFHTPGLLLATISTGLFVGLWRVDGLPVVWPFLIGGVVVGLVGPSLALVDPTLALYALALTFAVLGAARLRYPANLARTLAAIAGALIAYGAVALHEGEAVPIAVHAGLFAGINFFVAAGAGVVSLPQRRIVAQWPVLGLRILSSWLAAITMIMAALALR